MIAWVVIDRRQLRHSTPIPSSPLPQNLCTRFTLSPKSLSHNPFADPHPINPVVSILYKKGGAWGPLDALLFSESFPSKATTLLPTIAPVTPLAATLTDIPASVANKGLTSELSPLDATLTKNRGVPPSSQMPFSLRLAALNYPPP